MSTEIPLDDETRAALLLFNERLEETAASDRAAKRVAKAERAKDEAAAAVRKLGDNPKATAEEKAEAEEAYKAAVAEFNRISADPSADEPVKNEPADAEAGTEPEEADEGPADAEPSEMSADEEPAATGGSSDESE